MHIKTSNLFFMLCLLQSTSMLKSCNLRSLILPFPLQQEMKKHPGDPIIMEIVRGRIDTCAKCTAAGIVCSCIACSATSTTAAAIAHPCCCLSMYAFCAVPAGTAIANCDPKTTGALQTYRFQKSTEAPRLQ